MRAPRYTASASPEHVRREPAGAERGNEPLLGEPDVVERHAARLCVLARRGHPRRAARLHEPPVRRRQRVRREHDRARVEHLCTDQPRDARQAEALVGAELAHRIAVDERHEARLELARHGGSALERWRRDPVERAHPDGGAQAIAPALLRLGDEATGRLEQRPRLVGAAAVVDHDGDERARLHLGDGAGDGLEPRLAGGERRDEEQRRRDAVLEPRDERARRRRVEAVRVERVLELARGRRRVARLGKAGEALREHRRRPRARVDEARQDDAMPGVPHGVVREREGHVAERSIGRDMRAHDAQRGMRQDVRRGAPAHDGSRTDDHAKQRATSPAARQGAIVQLRC